MATEQTGFLRDLGALFDGGALASVTDAQLLKQFISRKDERAEAAFAELVRRHGPMVLRVCRASLRNEHDAHDAFQATFLILVHKARSLWVRETLGPWLHAVALRVTTCARAETARRTVHERRSTEMAAGPIRDETGDERDVLLHQEIARLPERFRMPVVLCDLEGLTHEQAAQRLGWPLGTVKSRQSRGRERLRDRLTQRGMAPAAVGPVLTFHAALAPVGTVPGPLIDATVQAAMCVLLGKTANAVIVAAPVAALVQKGLRSMLMAKWKLAAATILATGFVTTSVAFLPFSASGQTSASPGQATPRENVAKDPQADQPTAPSTQTPEEQLNALVREFENSVAAQRKNGPAAKLSPEALKNLSKQAAANPQGRFSPGPGNVAMKGRGAPRTNPLQRFYPRFLDFATRYPRTNTGEQALIWLATNARAQPEGETARAILARDHAQSDRIDSLFGPTYRLPWVSQASEDLLRRAIEQNPYREVRGHACYWLAEFLVYQAERIRLINLGGPAQREEERRMPGVTPEALDQVLKKDPKQLEDEAEKLYARIIDEFPFVSLPTGRLDAAAKTQLDELRRLSVGKKAPEITGVDLEGKPLRLSDFRGKAVVLYDLSATLPASSPRGLATLTQATRLFRSLAGTFQDKPVVFLGIVDGNSREAIQKVIPKDLTARFWWNPDQSEKPGPIRQAWNASTPNVYVIDSQGTIRFTRVYRPSDLENAVKATLKDQAGNPGEK